MTIEKQIAALCRKHQLARVELVVDTRGVVARAYPDATSPIVAKRREESFAGKTSVSLSEIEEITADALRPIAHVVTKTIDEAIADLSIKLRTRREGK